MTKAQIRDQQRIEREQRHAAFLLKQKEDEKIKVHHEPWTKFDAKDLRVAPKYLKNPVPCPQCKGHVSCIVDENAYGMGHHFKYACTNCGGMCACGWMEANEACLHDFSSSTEVGMCLHRNVCSKCGEVQVIDSGD